MPLSSTLEDNLDYLEDGKTLTPIVGNSHTCGNGAVRKGTKEAEVLQHCMTFMEASGDCNDPVRRSLVLLVYFYIKSSVDATSVRQISIGISLPLPLNMLSRPSIILSADSNP